MQKGIHCMPSTANAFDECLACDRTRRRFSFDLGLQRAQFTRCRGKDNEDRRECGQAGRQSEGCAYRTRPP
jgi:hypothetical protein